MPATIYRQSAIVLLVISCLFSGCHKKDPPQKTKTQLITAGAWKFTEAGLDTNNDGKIDTTIRPDLLPVCSFDNMYNFKTDSTAILDEGVNNCYGRDPRMIPFTWYFLNDETEFYMSIRIIPVYEGTSKIIELTANRFVISRQVGVHGFPSYLTFVIVLTR